MTNIPAYGTSAVAQAAFALLLEITNRVGHHAEAVRDGRLPRPRRTIRFMMGDECWGSMGYLACHPEKKHLCGIVADMIGTEKGDNAVLSLRYDPLSNWSFADAALFALAEIAGKESGEFAAEEVYVDVGTDNIIADPCFGVPTVALVASPTLSYHSSMDTPDRIEPAVLTRNALITGAYLWFMANADGQDCPYLAELIRRQTAHRLEGAAPRRKELLLQAQDRALSGLNLLGGSYPAPEEAVEPMPDYAKATGSRIPVRKVLGVLNLNGEYNGRTIKTSWNGDCMVVTCWIDGKRSLWEIAYLSAVEKNKCTDDEIREEFGFVLDGKIAIVLGNERHICKYTVSYDNFRFFLNFKASGPKSPALAGGYSTDRGSIPPE